MYTYIYIHTTSLSNMIFLSTCPTLPHLRFSDMEPGQLPNYWLFWIPFITYIYICYIPSSHIRTFSTWSQRRCNFPGGSSTLMSARIALTGWFQLKWCLQLALSQDMLQGSWVSRYAENRRRFFALLWKGATGWQLNKFGQSLQPVGCLGLEMKHWLQNRDGQAQKKYKLPHTWLIICSLVSKPLTSPKGISWSPVCALERKWPQRSHQICFWNWWRA